MLNDNIPFPSVPVPKDCPNSAPLQFQIPVKTSNLIFNLLLT